MLNEWKDQTTVTQWRVNYYEGSLITLYACVFALMCGTSIVGKFTTVRNNKTTLMAEHQSWIDDGEDVVQVSSKRVQMSWLSVQVLERAERAPSSNRWGSSMVEATLTRTRGATPSWSSRTSTCPCRPWSEPWRHSAFPSLTPQTRYAQTHQVRRDPQSRQVGKGTFY